MPVSRDSRGARPTTVSRAEEKMSPTIKNFNVVGNTKNQDGHRGEAPNTRELQEKLEKMHNRRTRRPFSKKKKAKTARRKNKEAEKGEAAAVEMISTILQSTGNMLCCLDGATNAHVD